MKKIQNPFCKKNGNNKEKFSKKKKKLGCCDDELLIYVVSVSGMTGSGFISSSGCRVCSQFQKRGILNGPAGIPVCSGLCVPINSAFW